MKFTCSWTTYERNRILVAAYKPSSQGCSCETTTVPAEPRHDLPPRSPSSTVVDGETFDDWRVSCILLFISIRICRCQTTVERSEEHTSELQSLMRISSAVFCLKKKNKTTKSLY